MMHIEKNICESKLGNLLEIEGKCKDNEKARLDMEQLGIRQDQHPVIDEDNYTLPPALYFLDKDGKKKVYANFYRVRRCLMGLALI